MYQSNDIVSQTAPVLLTPTTLKDADLEALKALVGKHNSDVLKFINEHPGFTHTSIEHHTNCGMLSTVIHQRINHKIKSLNIEAHCFPVNGRNRKHCWYLFKSSDLLNSEALAMAEKGFLG